MGTGCTQTSSGTYSSPMGKTPTIYDVAREAGVAPATVSRAFSRPGRVQAETAERIRAVAAELGYRVNPMARSLATSRTSTIALVVADISNPFYVQIVHGAQNAVTSTGYTLTLASTMESGPLERKSLERWHRAHQLTDVGLHDPGAGEAEADGDAEPGGQRGSQHRDRQRERRAQSRRAPARRGTSA